MRLIATSFVMLGLALSGGPARAGDAGGAAPAAVSSPQTSLPVPSATAPPAAAVGAPVPAATAETGESAPAGRPYSGLPKVVAQAVRQLEADCRREEGTARWSPTGVYTVVNVSPDGRPDYLIDTHAIACDDGVAPWMGSDGFRYILFVSTGPGRWTRAFDRPARIFEIVEAKDGQPARVEVFSHYAHCALPNPDRYMRCNQTYEWRGGRLRKVSEDWETN